MKNNSSMNLKRITIVGIGIAILVIGFILLGQGPADNALSLTISPLLLVFAYLVIVPIGILAGSKNDPEKGD